MNENQLAPKPFVCVVWLDAHGDIIGDNSEEDTKRDFHKAVIYRSFGLLLIDDEVGVSIATDFSPDDNTYRGRNFIPRGMVKEVISFGVPKRKRTGRKTLPAPEASAAT